MFSACYLATTPLPAAGGGSEGGGGTGFTANSAKFCTDKIEIYLSGSPNVDDEQGTGWSVKINGNLYAGGLEVEERNPANHITIYSNPYSPFLESTDTVTVSYDGTGAFAGIIQAFTDLAVTYDQSISNQ